jgi:hypothetical protein
MTTARDAFDALIDSLDRADLAPRPRAAACRERRFSRE